MGEMADWSLEQDMGDDDGPEQPDPCDRWECSTCGARYRTRHEVSSCESNHEWDYGPDQDWPEEN